MCLISFTMKIFTPESLEGFQLNRYTQYQELADERIDAQLIELSKQPHILEFEHEDSKYRGRFARQKNISEWMASGRIVYALTEGRDLKGISWFRISQPEEFSSGYQLTFGIRLYEGAVGRGFCMPFMREVHTDMAQFGQGCGIWLSAKQDNFRAIDKYEQFGYQYHHREKGLVYMVNDDALVI